MSSDAERRAEELVAGLLRDSGHRPAACAAVMRLAGEALARLSGDDQACRIHAELARRHALRSARYNA